VRGIELALERLRWVPPLGPGRYLVVNIPAFQLVGIDSAMAPGPPAVTMRVVVGSAMGTPTPLLFERLRHVEFLPYWYVPASILRGEILPMLEWTPDYLRTRDMEIVNRHGRVLGDSATPPLLRGLGRGELLVRQRPGPRNPLGLVKFIFPNGESVYLHDTPGKSLFAATQRDFSHGCISVEDPVRLAEWVLRDPQEWPREAIEAAMTGTRTRRVTLREPLPVLLFYTTAVAHADGSVWFYPDVYGLDRALTEALQARGAPLSGRGRPARGVVAVVGEHRGAATSR
jgi:murein L,D-transpeptidase YcbB/YkuD